MIANKCLPLVFLLWAGVTVAQHGGHGVVSAQKPVTLLPGLGKIHHPIQTPSPLAQKYFDQGLMLVYGFNHDEAVRSFEKAAALDPLAAMPYWGIAYALGPNINMDVDPAKEKAAYDAVQKAVKLSANAPANEKAYIAALARRYSDDPAADLKRLAREFADAMREVSTAYPDDLDAATIYAESLMDLNPWKLWAKDGTAAEGTAEIVATLERVLRRDPDHLGANHYYIHAVEASKHPEKALPSADRLGRIAPNSGHIVHMPGHIYLQLGDYEKTAVSNEYAAKADRAFIAASGATGVYPLMYYTHNLHFIAVARAFQGRYAEAKRAAGMMAANVTPALKDMPMLEPYVLIEWLVELQFHRWDAVLALPKPGEASSQRGMLWHYAQALALAGKGRTAEAVRMRDAYASLVAKIGDDAPFGTTNFAKPVLGIGVHVASAAIAECRKDWEEAIGFWRQAVAAEDATNYDEPAAWYYPVRQSLGAALLKAGKAAEAETVFREGLALHPRDGRLLFGLLEALRAQKKTAAVSLVQAQFEEAWKTAEVKLTLTDL